MKSLYSTLKAKLSPPYQFLREVIVKFIADDGINLAAGLSFFAILSTIPLALVLISVLGHLLGHQEQIFEQIAYWIQSSIPEVKPEFLSFLRQLVDKKVSTGWLGIGSMFLVASLIFSNIEHLLNKIFDTVKRRNYWHSKVFSVFLIIVTALLFFVPSQLDWLLAHFPKEGYFLKVMEIFSRDFTDFFAHGLLFFLLLNFVPKQSMPKKQIAIGGIVFAALTVLARQIFRLYMGHALARYHFIYGSLSLLVVLILWIYYLSILFVLCSEVVSVLQRRAELKAKNAE